VQDLTGYRKEIVDREATYDYLKEIFEDVTPLAELQKKKKAPRKTGRAKMLKKRAPVPPPAGEFDLTVDSQTIGKVDALT
jgi:hypothetical protein